MFRKRFASRAFEAGDCSFLVRSVGDVSAVFRAAVPHGLGTNPAAVRVFRKRSFSTCCATFRHFFYLLFRMAWARIWMLFECFGSASPKAFEAGDSSFLMRFVGDVSAVFRAAVSHGHGHESCCCSGVSEAFFFYLLCNVSALFLSAVSHGLGTNLDAVRMFRRSASPKAFEAGDSSFLVRSVGDVSLRHRLSTLGTLAF